MATLTLSLILLAAPACPPPAARPACEGALPVYEAGCATRWVCPADLAAEGLTRLDLSDGWLPHIFDEAPDLGDVGRQPYRAIYLKLAAGRVDHPDVEERAVVDRYFEPYGIFPNPSVVRARLLDAERHACRDAVRDDQLAAFTRIFSAYEAPEKQRKRIRTVRHLERHFTRVLKKREPEGAEPRAYGPADFEALGEEKEQAWGIRKWRRVRGPVETIRAAQDHLRCEGLLEDSDPPAVFGHRTQRALQIFQRKQMLGSRSHLDAESRAMLVEDSRELDYRALLRTLRERVTAASGLVEDGSALERWGTIFGRTLDSREFRYTFPDGPVEGGAEDRISPATEAAAAALGWTSPEATIERLETWEDLSQAMVAVKLPPPPPWHAPHMELRAEVDRGDVWYDYPFKPDGTKRYQPVKRRPSLTLFAQHDGVEIALFRWPTTIGSWKPEQAPNGATVLKYKSSDVGPRVWRRLIAGPSWLPPPTTPDEHLVMPDGKGSYQAKRDILGPSYASAYGLVMLAHDKPVTRRDGTVVWHDLGIRSHGSVSYRSIIRGSSHGCHRLFNHLAVRLADFLLKHRSHTVDGLIPTTYGRRFTHDGKTVTIRLRSRGFGYTLDPPVPVEVLRGRVRGYTRKTPKAARAMP